MPDGGPVPRYVRDIVLAALAGSFGSDFLATPGITSSTVAGPVPARLPSVQILDREMDYVFELDSGERLHLEFQERVDGGTIRRFLAYDALLLVRDGVRVHTAVVYTGAVNRAPDAFDFGSVHYSLAELRRRLAAHGDWIAPTPLCWRLCP